MKKRLLVVAVGPILLMAIAITVLTLTVIRTNIEEDTERTLQDVVYAYLASLEENEGLYEQKDDGTVWKGEFNIIRCTCRDRRKLNCFSRTACQEGNNICFHFIF